MVAGWFQGVSEETGAFVGAAGLILLVHVADLVLMTRVRIPNKARSATFEPVWRSLGNGVRYALSTPLLWGMLYVTIIMNALAFPLQQFIPDIGANSLGVGATLVGLLVAAEGLGQLAGAGAMALTRDLQRHGLVFLVGSTAVLIVGILFVWSPWYMLAFAVLLLGGIGQSGFGTMQSTITMLAAPAEMRGRMVGLMSVCIGIGTPLGALAIGIMAENVGTPWAITVNALAGLGLLLPSLIFTPLAWGQTRQVRAMRAD